LLVLRMDHEDPLYKCDNLDTYISVFTIFTLFYIIFFNIP